MGSRRGGITVLDCTDQGIPNTDPRSPPADFLVTTRAIYYGPPGATVTDAEGRSDWVANPLTVAVDVWP